MDIGFSLRLFDESKRLRNPSTPFRFTKASWLSFEVFNLMEVQNEASRT
ncbi:MAG: hypothetical protein R2788_23375 [Saprospiraceae bacterium]